MISLSRRDFNPRDAECKCEEAPVKAEPIESDPPPAHSPGPAMKTLLIALYPYNGQGLDSWHDHGSGMTYTAAKQAGCDIDFLDMKALPNDHMLRDRMRGYDLISFGLKSSYYPIAMKIVKLAKAQGSKVVVGGYHVTAAAHELLENPDIDWVFHGESEITFPKFLGDPGAFPREIWGERPADLDLLPFIDKSVYREPLENCFGWWHGGKLARMTSVISARGCPGLCQFCQPLEDNHFGRKLRRRSVSSLIEELKQLKQKYRPECVMIHDDTFLLQRKWIEEFIERYPEIGLPFWAAGRADGIVRDEDLVRKLVKIGWDLVSVGFESGSQKILDKMKKRTTVEQNLEAARIIHDTGAKIYGNYMTGLPWETKADIQDTAKMADQIAAEMPSWAYFAPYPGSGMGQECIDNGWSLLDREHYDRCPSGKKVKHVDYDYVGKVLAGFRETTAHVLTDIVIPTYENEQLTIACLQSIRNCTEAGTYRVILVDNGSRDTSRVDRALANINHLSIKLKKNEGFVGAVNRGITASTSPAVCLLNNDTRVSSGWLAKLTASLFADPKLGIVGALTEMSRIGGMDSHHSLDLHSSLVPSKLKGLNLEDTNRYLEEHYRGRTQAISFVAFLCAVIKREVIDKVRSLDARYADGLDAGYAMGMYDDNDYNLAVRKAGYRCELAIDTCIYHRGRSTFNLIQKTEKFDVGGLLKRNHALLQKNWGEGV